MPKFVGTYTTERELAKQDAYLSALFRTILIDSQTSIELVSLETGIPVEKLVDFQDGHAMPPRYIDRLQQWMCEVDMNRLYYEKPDIEVSTRRTVRRASWFVVDHPFVTLTMFACLVVFIVVLLRLMN